MTLSKLDASLLRGEAMLHEDLITPLHHHNDADNRLVATVDGTSTLVTPDEANRLVTRLRPTKRIDDPSVDHVPGGPKLGRRGLFKGSLIGLGGLLAASSVPRYSFAAGATDHLLVCIFLRGGFDGMVAVGLPNDNDYLRLRGSVAVTDTSFALSQKYVLNPNFGALKSLWTANDLAVVLGSGHPDISRSHFEDQDVTERAVAAAANVRSGWLGRHIQYSSLPSGTFRAITMGSSRVVTSLTTTAYQSLAMSSIKDFNLEAPDDDRDKLISDLGKIYGDAGGVLESQAKATLEAVTSLNSIRDDTYTPENGANYPDSDWAKGLKDIARLHKANMGLEVACIDYGNWDMHQGIGGTAKDQDGNYGWFAGQARDFAAGLAAFAKDLGDRWSKVTIVTMSEFGRRVEVNGDDGTDHGHGNVAFVLGGGINGGVYGDIEGFEDDQLNDGDLPISVDYRQALSEIVKNRLGNTDLAHVFPNFNPTANPLGIA